MSIVSGYNKYKRYILTNSGYKLVSQWTNANTVEMDDGSTLQSTITSLNSTLSSKQDVLIKGVPSDTSFDTINVPGIYWINPDVTTGNHPYPGNWGVLEVWEATTGSVMQRFTVFHNNISATRCYANNQWYTWQNKVRFWTDSEGGNIEIWGPNNNQWQIDSYNSDNLRFYTFNNGVYKAGHINGNGDLVSETGDVFNSVGTSLQGLKNRIDSLLYVTSVKVAINKAYQAAANVTAPSINGYNFVCWVGCATDGWIGSVYMQFYDVPSTQCWNATYGQNGSGYVKCYALYIRNY